MVWLGWDPSADRRREKKPCGQMAQEGWRRMKWKHVARKGKEAFYDHVHVWTGFVWLFARICVHRSTREIAYRLSYSASNIIWRVIQITFIYLYEFIIFDHRPLTFHTFWGWLMALQSELILKWTCIDAMRLWLSFIHSQHIIESCRKSIQTHIVMNRHTFPIATYS